jgi:hypothetical protein
LFYAEIAVLRDLRHDDKTFLTFSRDPPGGTTERRVRLVSGRHESRNNAAACSVLVRQDDVEAVAVIPSLRLVDAAVEPLERLRAGGACCATTCAETAAMRLAKPRARKRRFITVE